MSNAFKLKGLREKRSKVRTELEKLGTKLKTEQRSMSAEEKGAFEQLQSDWSTLGEQIQTVEADISAIQTLLDSDGEPADAGGDPNADPSMNKKRPEPGRTERGLPKRRSDGNPNVDLRADRSIAFQAWARKQAGMRLTRAHVEACKRTGLHPRSKDFVFRLNRVPVYKRGLDTTTSGSSGGKTIAQDFSDKMEIALKDYSALRGLAEEIRTDTGADMPYPTEDDTSNTGELLSESTEGNYADDTYGSITLKAYKYSSKGMLISFELLNDSFFDMESIIGTNAGIRIGRAQGAAFTTGTGSSQPKGVVVCASAGLTTALATAFTADELLRLAFTVDPAYRVGSGVGYMMNDSVLAYALTLKDSTGRPLLRESYRDGVAAGQMVVNGFPVYPNQFMVGTTTALPVTATKHVLFGDYSKMKIRDAGEVRLKKLEERWAEKDQVGFIAFLRSDCNCTNTAAIKYMLQA